MNDSLFPVGSRPRAARPLCGMRIALLEGRTVDAVRLERLRAGFEREGAEVCVVAPELELELELQLEDAASLRADERLASAAPERFHALCVPGSAVAVRELCDSAPALELVAAFAASGKWITAFDHAPLLLMQAVGVAGRTLTSDPTLEDALTNAGALWLPEPTVVDGAWLTADGARLAAALQVAAAQLRIKSIEPPPFFGEPRSASPG